MTDDLRPLGRSGLSTRPFALGGNVFGWTADEATSHQVLDRFVGEGFTLIDTADIYSTWIPGHVGGESETVIGSWMKARGNRANVLIATKVGGEIAGEKGLSAKHIRTAVEASLKRLQTDYIDLYQSHFDDDAAAFDETLGAFNDLIVEGKVRAIGLSNHSPERMRAVLGVAKASGLPRYETLQPHYNLHDREDFERGYARLCLDEGIGVINYYALASGFLSGKYRGEGDFGKSPRGRGMKKYFTDRGFRILDALDQVAARLGAAPAQVAIAWLVAQPAVTAPIASATSVKQLDDLIAGVRLKLDADALAALDAASAY